VHNLYVLLKVKRLGVCCIALSDLAGVWLIAYGYEEGAYRDGRFGRCIYEASDE
jgi:hypothetical protein